MLDALTNLVARPKVGIPSVLAAVGIKVTDLQAMLEQTASVGTDLCIFGIMLCMLSLWIRKLWLTLRGDPRAKAKIALED